MKLIDADHLRKWILSWWEKTEPTSEFLKGGDILNQIDREPTIDIVRCEECKAYDSECEWCNGLGLEMKADDFCSYGKRKSDD